MQSSWHDHFCKKCGHGFICYKVTHCDEPLETLCLDHKMEALKDNLRDAEIKEPT